MGNSDGQDWVAFTGHRPQILGGFDPNAPMNLRVRAWLDKTIERLAREGRTTFVSGGALGVDQWAALSVLSYPFLDLVLALPYGDYGGNWPPESQAVLQGIREKAKTVHIVCEGAYENWKNTERNKWMVDHSSLLCAVWTGQKDGGTAHCVKYAKAQGKTIIRYNPVSDQEEPA